MKVQHNIYANFAIDVMNKLVIGKKIIATALAIIALSATSLRAQEDYKTLKAQVAELEKSGNYAAAIPVAERAVKQVEIEYTKSNYRYVAALTKLGEIYQGAEQFDKAEKTFLEVVALDKAKYGETEMVYAESISRLGSVYSLQGKLELALPLFMQAMTIKKSNLGESIIYANALNNIGAINFNLGKYPEAETFLTDALRIYNALETSPSVEHANAKNSLGVIYTTLGRYEDAEVLLQSAVEWRKQLKGSTSQEYAESLRNLAGLYKNMGRYTESEKAHQESIGIVKLRGEKTLSYASSLYNFALLHGAVGNFKQEENMLKESLSIYKSILGEKSTEYSNGIGALANLYANMGMISEAETFYKQQLQILKSALSDQHPDYATALANLASLLYQAGRFEQAESMYLNVKELDKRNFGESSVQSASTLYYLASLYREMNKLSASEEYFKKAMEIQKNQWGITHPEYIQSLIGLGKTYLKSGKAKEGVEMYAQCFSYFDSPDGQMNANYSTFISDYGVLLKAGGYYELAEKLYNKAIQVQAAQFGETNLAYITTLINFGDLYISMGKPERADPIFKKVLSTCLADLRTQFPSMSEREKSQFYKTISFPFEIFKTFAVTAGNQNNTLLGDMYNNQLATKGMLINATVQLKNQILRSKNDALIAQYKSWVQKKEQMARARKLTIEEREKRKINLEVLENETNELERNLSAQSERFNSIAKRSSYTWQEVRSKLKSDEAAIEIIRFNKFNSKLTSFTDTVFYAALIVKPTLTKNPELVLLSNGKELETKFLKYYRNMIQQQKGADGNEDRFSYNQFWKPIAQQLTGISKIYLSVDGIYNQINLNTLINPETSKYVIDEVDIEVVTNTSDILKPKASRASKKQTASLLGFPNYYMSAGERTSERKKSGISGEELSEVSTVDVRTISSLNAIKELPGTKTEVESIAKILSGKKWETQILLNNAALEENVKMLQGPNLFHIATHGFFEPDVDEKENTNLKYENALFRSGLLLAGSAETLYKKANALEVGNESTEDGVLTAYEAMNIDLNATELVVLSACETGLGEVTNGEGVYGLQRAFKVAGAEAIIFSLWKVDDAATQKLMTSFYNFWLASGNKRESFTKAQLAIREEFKSPYYWGAFVLIGD